MPDTRTPSLLAGQVVVVTGAGQGIGAGIARSLGLFGASVVVASLTESRALETAAALTARGISAIGVRHDVTNSASCDALAAAAVDAFGAVDLLVNNAGTSGRSPLDEMDESTWESMIDVNLTGVQRTTRPFVAQMKERRHGSIVSISSVAGRAGKANMSHYCATKFGVIGFSQALALELAPFNVRVNCVCPGIVRTRLWEIELEEISLARNVTIEEAWNIALESIPMRRPQTPEDIGAAVAFLASPLAKNITGQSLNVDGGYEMS